MSRYIDADLIRYDEDIPGVFIASKTRINNIPTADVRENVKGEWLPDFEYDGEDEWCFNQCSLCDYQSDEQYNFCPNCGADMRGEA